MNVEYFKDQDKARDLCKFIAYLLESCNKLKPDNASQFDDVLADKLDTFIKEHKLPEADKFKATAYAITDAMNYGVNLLPSIHRLSGSYEPEFLPENESVIAGIIYGAVIMADVQQEFKDKSDFLATTGFLYDMVAIARRSQQRQATPTSRLLH
jgi:hypothetical protein